ncbi:MAG TPA: hydroxymethylglutaryl-CoA synthase [Blastocatellia bacterium]|nr:hydroxymethylglutaryl-CoA synthase [Blastocatellia bacterium]
MVGLEALAFSVPQYFINLTDLAIARGIDPDKYTSGLGQREMSVATPCEDAVTLAASAGRRLLSNFDIDPESIALLIVGAETGIDYSKPIASYVHEMLGLPSLCRSFEIKHACYGGMAGLFTASQWTMSGRAAGRKALVIATDIARYGVGTPGEPTQGAGAVAMLISDKPALIEFDTSGEGYYSKQVMDFWRPIYSKEAFADGHYSIACYLDALQYSYAAYRRTSGHDGDRHFADRFVACLYHTPFVKMAQKAHQRLLETDAGAPFAPDGPEMKSARDDFARRVAPSLEINARVGNIYTGSLFLSLVNFLEDQGDRATARLFSLFSYGSGCQAEFITARVGERAGQAMKRQSFRAILEGRTRLDVRRYEEILEANGVADFNDSKVCDPDVWHIEGPFVYTGARNHQRQYLNRGTGALEMASIAIS